MTYMVIQGLRPVYIALLFFALVIVSCKDSNVMPEEMESGPLRSFLVAGHVYGGVGVNNEGFHPPFSSYLESADLSNIDYSFLTGDVVIQSTEKDWIDVQQEMDLYPIEWHIAPGNHDLIDTEVFDEFNEQRSYSFEDDQAVYLILNSTENGWSFLGEQLELFKSALQTADSKNLLFFVFMHHLAWYEEDNKYAVCEPNWMETKTGTSNFLSELIPLIEGTNVAAYIFAGDIGVREEGCAVMYDDLGFIHLIGSGMGGGINDNIIKVSIGDFQTVDLDLIAINGEDQRALGEITEWQI